MPRITFDPFNPISGLHISTSSVGFPTTTMQTYIQRPLCVCVLCCRLLMLFFFAPRASDACCCRCITNHSSTCRSLRPVYIVHVHHTHRLYIRRLVLISSFSLPPKQRQQQRCWAQHHPRSILYWQQLRCIYRRGIYTAHAASQSVSLLG